MKQRRYLPSEFRAPVRGQRPGKAVFSAQYFQNSVNPVLFRRKAKSSGPAAQRDMHCNIKNSFHSALLSAILLIVEHLPREKNGQIPLI